MHGCGALARASPGTETPLTAEQVVEAGRSVVLQGSSAVLPATGTIRPSGA